jgi:hypothetical protein
MELTVMLQSILRRAIIYISNELICKTRYWVLLPFFQNLNESQIETVVWDLTKTSFLGRCMFFHKLDGSFLLICREIPALIQFRSVQWIFQRTCWRKESSYHLSLLLLHWVPAVRLRDMAIRKSGLPSFSQWYLHL